MNSSMKMAAPKPVATIVLVPTLKYSFIFFSPFDAGISHAFFILPHKSAGFIHRSTTVIDHKVKTLYSDHSFCQWKFGGSAILESWSKYSPTPAPISRKV
jgi:hypothetical protein